MNWIDTHAAAIQAIGTATSVIVTVVLVVVTWFAWRTTKAALQAAREANDNAIGMRRDHAGALIDPLTFNTTSEASGTELRLEYANTGASSARNIRMRLILPDGEEIEGRPKLLPILSAGSAELRRTVQFPLRHSDQVADRFKIEVAYEDRFGSQTSQVPLGGYEP